MNKGKTETFQQAISSLYNDLDNNNSDCLGPELEKLKKAHNLTSNTFLTKLLLQLASATTLMKDTKSTKEETAKTLSDQSRAIIIYLLSTDVTVTQDQLLLSGSTDDSYLMSEVIKKVQTFDKQSFVDSINNGRLSSQQFLTLLKVLPSHYLFSMDYLKDDFFISRLVYCLRMNKNFIETLLSPHEKQGGQQTVAKTVRRSQIVNTSMAYGKLLQFMYVQDRFTPSATGDKALHKRLKRVGVSTPTTSDNLNVFAWFLRACIPLSDGCYSLISKDILQGRDGGLKETMLKAAYQVNRESLSKYLQGLAHNQPPPIIIDLDHEIGKYAIGILWRRFNKNNIDLDRLDLATLQALTRPSDKTHNQAIFRALKAGFHPNVLETLNKHRQAQEFQEFDDVLKKVLANKDANLPAFIASYSTSDWLAFFNPVQKKPEDIIAKLYVCDVHGIQLPNCVIYNIAKRPVTRGTTGDNYSSFAHGAVDVLATWINKRKAVGRRAVGFTLSRTDTNLHRLFQYKVIDAMELFFEVPSFFKNTIDEPETAFSELKKVHDPQNVQLDSFVDKESQNVR